MLSENPKELFDLLASIPGENPRVSGWGGSHNTPSLNGGEIPAPEVDDFPGTEALFLSEISPEWQPPLPSNL